MSPKLASRIWFQVNRVQGYMAWINAIGYSLLHSHNSGVRWVGQGMTGICLVGFALPSSELLTGVSGKARPGSCCGCTNT